MDSADTPRSKLPHPAVTQRRMVLVEAANQSAVVTPWTSESPRPSWTMDDDWRRVHWFMVDRFGNVVSFADAYFGGMHRVVGPNPFDVLDTCTFHEGGPCDWDSFTTRYGSKLAALLAEDPEHLWVALSHTLCGMTDQTAAERGEVPMGIRW